MAQPFDAGNRVTTGDAFPIAEQVENLAPVAYGAFSVSQNGVLVYTSGGGGESRQLTWFDRSGKILGTVGDPGIVLYTAISPDGSTVAYERQDLQFAKRETGRRWPTCWSSPTNAPASPGRRSRSCCRGWRRSPRSPRSSSAIPSGRWRPAARRRDRAHLRPRAESQRRILLKPRAWIWLAALLNGRPPPRPIRRTDGHPGAGRPAPPEKLGNAKRAIDVYREILRADPHDAVSMRALVDLRARGDFAGLATRCASRSSSPTSKQERVGLLAGCW